MTWLRLRRISAQSPGPDGSQPTGVAQVAQQRALAKAGVPIEVVEAELHRAKFERVLDMHPTPGRFFLDTCVPGIVNLIDEYAEPGEGMSSLLFVRIPITAAKSKPTCFTDTNSTNVETHPVIHEFEQAE